MLTNQTEENTKLRALAAQSKQNSASDDMSAISALIGELSRLSGALSGFRRDKIEHEMSGGT